MLRLKWRDLSQRFPPDSGSISNAWFFPASASATTAGGEEAVNVPDDREAVAFAGLALALLDGLQAAGSLAGDLLCLLGAVGWACTTTRIGRRALGQPLVFCST